MSKKNNQILSDNSEGFLSRWSKLKLHGNENKESSISTPAVKTTGAAASVVSGQQEENFSSHTIPADESGQSGSDMNTDSSKDELHKLFHSPQYNQCDTLDDYNENLTYFESLGDILTHEVRHEMEAITDSVINDNEGPADLTVNQDISEDGTVYVEIKNEDTGDQADLNPYRNESISHEELNVFARAKAQNALASYLIRPTSSVYYTSGNSLLVISDKPVEGSLLESICDKYEKNSLLIVFTPANVDGSTMSTAARGMGIHYMIEASPLQLTGHLGKFRISAYRNEHDLNLGQQSPLHREFFDVVLDLSATPVLTRAVSPFGYISVHRDDKEILAHLADLASLQGKFQKPKFFNYDESICAHAASGLTGCQNCVEACPAEAITSDNFKISVDPYLCQGCGTCTSVCPTGAMTYAYPHASDTLNRIRLMLGQYLDSDGRHPSILFYETDLANNMDVISRLPVHVLPCEVEEITSTGMEVWLAALAYGASHVILITDKDTLLDAWQQQLVYAWEILQGMGYTEPRLHLIESGDSEVIMDRLQQLPPCPQTKRAGFLGLDDKRTVIRLAVKHLLHHAPAPQVEIPLSNGAPYGRVEVNKEACTLCMSCDSLCPKGAITGGGDTPVLYFVEADCVQCGLCKTGCPENAIQLSPRYLYDRKESSKQQILNEEIIFSCITCGKPFATEKMITTIMEKLKDHAMFQEGRIRHLQMCEDCRVKAQFEMPLKKQ